MLDRYRTLWCNAYVADNRYRVNAGSVFSLEYHLVWCPKYRKRILIGREEFPPPHPGVFMRAAEKWVPHSAKRGACESYRAKVFVYRGCRVAAGDQQIDLPMRNTAGVRGRSINPSPSNFVRKKV